MNTPATIRRPYFKGEDDGFASIPKFSGNNNSNFGNHNIVNYQTQPYIMRRMNSFRNFSSSSTASAATTITGVCSPRSAPHFLESCSLCRTPLGGNRDIFMYRGDTPFCSEECRQEQIEIDEAEEKNWNFKSLRIVKDSKKSWSSSSSPSKAQNYSFRPSTVAAA